jgi:sugar/nucleoside kinase (ribokinase family)
VAASDPITADDVPPNWRRADCVHLGPLHRGDLAPGLAASLEGMVGLDVQGLLRESGPEGTRLRPNPELPLHLDGVHVVQVSASELRALVGSENGTALEFARRYGVPELVVTRGRRGATVIADGAAVDVEPAPSSGTSTVGAGDTFLAAYLEARVRTQCSPADAARAASRVTALKIEHGGVPKGIDLEKLCG